MANWLFAQTTHVVGSKPNFAWWVACGVIKCDPNWLRGYGAVGGRKWPFPITFASGLYNSLYYRTSRDSTLSYNTVIQWLKLSCEAGGHLTKPGWSKPHTHSTLALFGYKITLYRFNQGAHTIAGGSNRSKGLRPLAPHFNHCCH